MGERLVFSIVIYVSFISVSGIYISYERVNNLELYTFVIFDVFMNSQIHENHEFDGHLVHSNTHFNTFIDHVKPDPIRVLPRTIRPDCA